MHRKGVGVSTHRVNRPHRLRPNRAPRTGKGRIDIVRAMDRPTFDHRGARLDVVTGVKISEDGVAVERAEREVQRGTKHRALE